MINDKDNEVISSILIGFNHFDLTVKKYSQNNFLSQINIISVSILNKSISI